MAELIAELTGAQDGFVVNNGAGAALLAVAALAGPGREVIVSRGQLVEIGGGFRVPDVVRQMGARLVEVGTTNRTRLADYDGAIGPDTGAILRVHPSNFRQVGFVEEVGVEELCGLGVPVVDDVGSGALTELELLDDEPPVRALGRRRRGARLLQRRQAARRPAGRAAGRHARGGDQGGGAPAGPRAADRQALARRARGDAAPAPRPRGGARGDPVLAMLRASEDELAARAERLAAVFPGARSSRPRPRSAAARCRCSSSRGRPSRSIRSSCASCAPAIRRSSAACSEDRLLLDPRTLTDEEVGWIAATR